ncbi:hypothetical protein [Tateyamaria sp. ANG-S1]|uniref:hypothetical protein n=1 Tax=Tateyamaria sp. ANG-S1 TaxID=1577905 RepID=UPI0005801D9E|nr:hypothetical protein [Tateyamaria sp. ANG-S1]KIC50099.1 hypothetical protein RA29_10960 [Tateyamaria sp. ANG-S1]
MKTARAVAAAACLIGSTAQAEWRTVEGFSDPFNGFDTRAAVTEAADGTTLHLYRNPAGRVYALFSLPDDSADFAGEGAVATLTPQGFKTKSIEARAERGRVVEYAMTQGRSLRDRLWHGEGTAPAFGTLHDLIEAPEVTATFTLSDGSTHSTSWSMEGAGTPVAHALGITIEGAAAGQEWEEAAAQALLAAMTTCQFPKLDVSCVQKVTACSDKISTDRDIDGFDACVAKGTD